MKETWWDAITRFMVYVIHFRRLEICLLASHLEEVYAHFEEVKSYSDEVPFCLRS